MDEDLSFHISADALAVIRAMRQTQNSVDQLALQTAKRFGDMQRAGQSLANLFGGLFAGLSVGVVVGKLVSVQREFDVLSSSLTTVTGSSAAAESEMRWIKEFAATTPFALTEVTQAFVKMKALGLDASQQALESYGNTASAMGKNLNQLIEAVADAATGEFERLKEFGIKASTEGNKVSLVFRGVTTTIGKNADEITAYLQQIGNNEFAGAMALRAATLDGAISNLGDTWDELFRTVNQGNAGDVISDSVRLANGVLGDAVDVLQALNEATAKNAEDTGALATFQRGLGLAFEIVTLLAIDLKYVLVQTGRELGALAAQAVAVATLDFARAREIGRLARADAEVAREDVERAGRAVVMARQRAQELDAAAKAGAGNDAQSRRAAAEAKVAADAERAAKAAAAKAAAAAAEAAKAANKELEEQRKLIAELNGLQPDYIEQLTRIGALRAKATLSETEYVAAVEALIAKQPSSIKLAKEQTEIDKQRVDTLNALAELERKRADTAEQTVTGLTEQNQALREEIELIGLTERAQLGVLLARNETIVLTKEATLAELERASTVTGTQTRIEIALAEEIRLLRERAGLLTEKLNRTEVAKVYEDLQAEGKRFVEQLEQGLTDSLFRAFEAGRGFFATLWDGIKNLFKTTVLKAIIQPVVGGITGSLGLTSAANAATTGSGIGNLLNLGSNLSTAYSALTGSFIGTLGSAATSIGTTIGSTAIAEFGLGLKGFQTFAALEGGVTGALGAGASTGSFLSSAAAAGPYVLAAVAALNALGVFRSRKIVDGGLQGELGGQVNDYALERKGGTLFSGPSYRVLDRGVSAQNEELQLAYNAIRNSVAGMAEQLGIGNDAIKAFTVQLGNDLIHPDTGGFGIKTQGLSQDEIIAKIEAALLSANDQLAAFALGTDTFTRNGETATQTLGRLSGSLQTLNGSLDLMGFKLLDASLASADAASRLIDSFGGIEGYLQVSSSFYQNYFTEAERTAKLTEQLTAQFAELGFALPTSRQGLRDLVQQQIALGTEALPTVAALLKLEGAFASITQATAEAAQTLQVQADALGQQRVQDLQLARAAASETAQRVAELRDQQQAVFTEGVAQMQGGLQVAQALLDAATLISQVQIQSAPDGKLSADKEAAIVFRNTLNAANQFAENFQRIPNASPGLEKLFDKLSSAFLRIDNRLSINGETSAPGRAIGLLGLANRADVSPALGFKLSEELNASFKDFLAGGANLLRRELEEVAGVAAFDASRVTAVITELYRAQNSPDARARSSAERFASQELGVSLDALNGPIEGVFQAIEQRAAESRVKLLDAFGVTEADLASVGNDLQAKLTATVVRAAGTSFDEAISSYRFFVGQIGDMADEIRAAAEQTQTAEQKFSGLFQSFTDSLSRPLVAARGALDESIRAQGSLRQILDTGNVTLENRIILEGQLTEATQQVISAQRQLQSINQFAEPVIAAGKQLQALIDAPALAAGRQAIQGLGLSVRGAAVSAKIVGSVYQDNAQSVYNAYILLNEAFEKNQLSVADYQKSINGVARQFEEGARSLEEFKQQMQAIVDFRKSLDAGPNALLSPEQQYQAALRDFRQADKENFVAAGQALLDASQAFNAGTAAYFADLEAVKRRADLLSGGGGLLGGIPGFAEGGYYPGGLAVVGEQGREIINFRNPGQVYTAPQTRELLAGGGNNDKLAAEVKELRATVVNMGRMMQAAFGQQIQLIEEGNADRRAVVKVTKQVAEGMTP